MLATDLVAASDSDSDLVLGIESDSNLKLTDSDSDGTVPVNGLDLDLAIESNLVLATDTMTLMLVTDLEYVVVVVVVTTLVDSVNLVLAADAHSLMFANYSVILSMTWEFHSRDLVMTFHSLDLILMVVIHSVGVRLPTVKVYQVQAFAPPVEKEDTLFTILMLKLIQ